MLFISRQNAEMLIKAFFAALSLNFVSGGDDLGLRREAKRHAAFVRTKTFISSFGPRAGESGVAAALCHRSPRHFAACRFAP